MTNYVQVDDERFEIVRRMMKQEGDYLVVTLQYKKPLTEGSDLVAPKPLAADDTANPPEGRLLGCEHKSDGNVYTSNPPQLKCGKCGKFYKMVSDE